MKKCGNSEKIVTFYHCEKCNYKCSKKQHWKQHCKTKKHNANNANENANENANNANKCLCGKIYKHIASLSRHKKTCEISKNTTPEKEMKQMKQNETKMKQNETNEINDTYNDVNKLEFICKKCNTSYNSRTTLWRHKQTCNSTELTIYQPEDTITTNNSNSIMEKLMEQLTEQNTNENMECILKQMLVQQAEQNKIILTQQTEQNKLMIELANKPTIQNNNNQTFNLNTFLNVDCKDAMNIEDFISSIKVSIEDLKDIRTYGFLYSMDIAMMNKLKDMKQIERPIHCTDKKRKKFYIKKNNEWNKDCDQKEVYEIIKDVNMIQRKSFVKWSKDIQAQNPQWSEDMHFYNEVIEILDKLNSLFGVDEDVLKLKKKLFSTIIEYTTIKKSKMNGTNNIYKQGVVGE